MARSRRQFNVWIVYSDLFINLTVFVSLAAVGMAVMGVGSEGAGNAPPNPCELQEGSLQHLDGAFLKVNDIPTELGCASYYLPLDFDLMAQADSEGLRGQRPTGPSESICIALIDQIEDKGFRQSNRQLDLIAVDPREPDLTRDLCRVKRNEYKPEPLTIPSDGIKAHYDGLHNCLFKKERDPRRVHPETCEKIEERKNQNTAVQVEITALEGWIQNHARKCSRRRFEQPLKRLVKSCKKLLENKAEMTRARDSAALMAKDIRGRRQILNEVQTASVLVDDLILPAGVVSALPKDRASVVIRVRAPQDQNRLNGQ